MTLDHIGKVTLTLAALGLVAFPTRVAAQDGMGREAAAVTTVPEGLTRGPVPAPVVAPQYFAAAVERGSRTETGQPGPDYWQNWARYDLQARLDPETASVEGAATILYTNHAPVSLRVLAVHLYQNLHKEGVPRNNPEEITGGVELARVVAGGLELKEGDLASGPGYEVDGTVMRIRPPTPVETGDSVTLEFEWAVTLPQHGAGRMGWTDHNVYFVAYWFPRMAVFDDLRGWDAPPYLSRAEFYDGFGDYRAAITVRAGWTVMGTGELTNPTEVYSATTLERLERASTSDERVEVATLAELRAGAVTTAGSDGWLTYRFAADTVRDFAWTTSNVQRWDAASAVVPDRDGDGVDDRVLIHSFWPEGAPNWDEQWRYAKQSVEHHSRFTGYAYPWSHMTTVQATDIFPEDDGMEFPMMTLIGPYTETEPQELFNVTSHEIGHMWIPMIAGANENRHAWIDEGSTSFIENQSRMEFWPGVDHHRLDAQRYYEAAAAGLDQSMMREGDWYEPGPGYWVDSYNKPAMLMVALRGLLGEDVWMAGYRAFISEWAFKYPTPWDFFNTFERVAGRDLDWFWTSFYYETWTVDFEIGSVDANTQGGGTVRIDNLGFAPFPVTVRVHTTSGGVVERELGLERWADGARSAEFDVPAGAGVITRIEVDPEGATPDVDRSNNFWPRG